MLSSRVASVASSALFITLPIAVVLAGCSSETGVPGTVADLEFLPTGTYAQTVVAASCNVNATFRNAERVALFRNGPGTPQVANVPLPVAFESDGTRTSLLGPRQDVSLTTKHAEIKRGSSTCAATLDFTELDAKHVAISYREGECNGVSACSVDYTLVLVEAACASDCAARSASLDVSGGTMKWRCDCQ